MKNTLNTIKHISKAHKLLVISFTIFFLFSVTIRVFATPPTSPYQAGNTLDPTCAPGDANCFVEIIASQTGNSGKFLTTDGTSTSWNTITTTQAIGDAITNATEGSILFAGSGGTFAQDNANFFWDDTNNRLGVGTASPSAKLSIDTPTNYDGIRLTNSGYALAQLNKWADEGGYLELLKDNSAFSRIQYDNSFINSATVSFSGNVGIGTSSPVAKLSVQGDYDNTGTGGILLDAYSTVPGRYDFRINPYVVGSGNVGYNFHINNNGSSYDAMSITGTGRIGIGTTSPGYKLDVKDVTVAQARFYGSLDGSASDAHGQILLGSSAGYYGSIGYSGAGGKLFLENTYEHDASQVVIRVHNTASATIDAVTVLGSGNVGIGTTNPVSKLQINNGTGISQLGAGSSGADIILSTGGGVYASSILSSSFGPRGGGEAITFIDWDAVPLMTIITATGGTKGNVGIGTTSPGNKLEIYDVTSPTIKLNNGTYSATLSQGSSYETTLAASSYLKLTTTGGAVYSLSGTKNYSWNDTSISGDNTAFAMYAGHAGSFGFTTVGATSVYNAIQPVYTDNNTGGLKFNYKTGGTDTEGMRLTSAGKVGIGTDMASTNNYGLLNVNGRITAETEFLIDRTAGNTSAYMTGFVRESGATGAFSTGITGQGELSTYGLGAFVLGTSDAKPLIFGTSGVERIRILSDGSVGIGTSTPGSLLSLSKGASGQALIQIDKNGSTHYIGAGDADYIFTGIGSGDLGIRSSGSIQLGTGGNNIRMTMLNSGNIGINNTAPTSLFEIGSDANDSSTSYTDNIWDSKRVRINGGNLSIFSSGAVSTIGDSYQLSFYARYYNGGQGYTTNKGGYIKSSVVTDNTIYPGQYAGKGILILGSTSTDYNGTPTFNDIPAMYITHGKVGVGISTPTAKFEISNSASGQSFNIINPNNSTNFGIAVGDGSQAASGQVRIDGGGNAIVMHSGGFIFSSSVLTASGDNTIKMYGGWGGATVGDSVYLGSGTGNSGNFSATSGTQNSVTVGIAQNGVTETWQPTSGNATYNLLQLKQAINTSGSYSGIVRSMYINPTLTSLTGVDYRGIDIAGDGGYSIYQGGSSAINYFAGKVGVGTTTPGAKLEIAIPNTSTTGLRIKNVSGNSQNLFEINSASGSGGDIFKVYPNLSGQGGFYSYDGYGSNLEFKNRTLSVNNMGSSGLVSLKLSYNDTIYGLIGLSDASGDLEISNTWAGYGINIKGTSSSAIYVKNSTSNVGIQNTAPAYTLHAGTSSTSGIVARFENSTGTCDINPTTTSLSCSSDINLKKNITTLDGTDFILNIDSETQYATNLDKLLALNVVTYNWNTEDDTANKHIGFIAQQVESVYPDLVTTDINTGLKSLNITNMIPYTIAGIQQINVTLTGMQNLDESSSFVSNLRAWLGSLENNLSQMYATVIKSQKVETKELCIDDLCINKNQLQQILNSQNIQTNSYTPEETPPEENTDEEGSEDEVTPPEETPEENVDEPPAEETPTEEEVVVQEEDTPPQEEPQA